MALNGADAMTGAFRIPGEIRASDYIEIGEMRAHSARLRYDFSGFLPAGSVVVNDPGLLH